MYFILCLIIIAVCITTPFITWKKTGDDELTGLNFIVSLIVLIVVTFAIFHYNPIKYSIFINETNKKINLYEKQNNEIDNEIKSIVTTTYDKELSLYKDIKNKSAIELVTIFPKVKSVDLVNKQMDIYISNKKKINKLKESKIELESSKIQYQLW